MVPKRRQDGPASSGRGKGGGIRCCAAPPSRRDDSEQRAPRRLATAHDSDSCGSSSRSSASMEFHYQAGHHLYAAGDYAEAAEALSLAIQHGHPAKARCHNTRGASLTALERHADAVAAFTCALVHEPGMHAAWSNRGLAQWKRGDLRAAVTDLRQASLLHPSEENARLLEDAEAEWANPAAASSFKQALHHFARAEWEEARVKFEAALEMNDPRATRCHNGIGLCYFVEGAKEPALAALSRATEVDPSNANAWHNYAKALSQSGREIEAAAAEAKAVGLKRIRPKQLLLPSPAAEPSTLMSLASSEWIVPNLAPLTMLQASQLRLVLGSLLHRRLGAEAMVVVKDIDVVETIARYIRGCHPLAWTRGRDTLGIDVETSSVVMAPGGDYGTAMCSESPMRDGVHYAEFELLTSHLVTLGVADLRFDPNGEERMVTATEFGWGYRAWDGKHSHASTWSAWEGMQPATCGDKVGLLMDCDSGRLSVYKNRERLGTLCHKLGGAQRELCWMAQLWVDGASVRVRREERPDQSPREHLALAGPPELLPQLLERVPPPRSGGRSRAETQLGSIPASSPPPLPDGWVVVTSRADGAPYFHNEHTGESCWHIPPPTEFARNCSDGENRVVGGGGGGGASGGGESGEGALPQGTLRRELLARNGRARRSRTL